MTTNTIQNQQQQNEEIQQETEFTHDNNINKNNPEDNNSNIEDTPTSTNHDTPIIRNKEEEMPRNIIIQQETPNPSKTKKLKNPKKQTNLYLKTRHGHLNLQLQLISNNPHKTTFQQYLILLTQTYNLQLQPKLSNQPHLLHPTQPNYFNRNDKREC